MGISREILTFYACLYWGRNSGFAMGLMADGRIGRLSLKCKMLTGSDLSVNANDSLS